MDFPRKIDPDVIPDGFAEYVPEMEQPNPRCSDLAKLAKVGEEEGREGGAGDGQGGGKAPSARRAKPCDEACQEAKAEARRARLREQVAKMGVLKLLGTKGKGGTGVATDLLGCGDPGTGSDKAFKGVGGLTTAGRGGKGAACGARAAAEPAKPWASATWAGAWAARARVDTGGAWWRRCPGPWSSAPGKIERDGTIKADEVARTIRRGMGAIRGCYQRALKRNPKLSGKIVDASDDQRHGQGDRRGDRVGHRGRLSGHLLHSRLRQALALPATRGRGTAEVAVPFVFQAAD